VPGLPPALCSSAGEVADSLGADLVVLAAEAVHDKHVVSEGFPYYGCHGSLPHAWQGSTGGMEC
jgi:hypothetical protein